MLKVLVFFGFLFFSFLIFFFWFGLMIWFIRSFLRLLLMICLFLIISGVFVVLVCSFRGILIEIFLVCWVLRWFIFFLSGMFSGFWIWVMSILMCGMRWLIIVWISLIFRLVLYLGRIVWWGICGRCLIGRIGRFGVCWFWGMSGRILLFCWILLESLFILFLYVLFWLLW